VKPLYMLLMLTSIAVVVCSSLMYFIERGRYNKKGKYWERIAQYYCDVTVAADPGKSLPVGMGYDAGLGNDCTEKWASDTRDVVTFSCPYPYDKTTHCIKEYEQSPFSSIPETFWWSWVTMTTVGYGDMYPTTRMGKTLGMIIMLFGILVIALPITVIGSNFATVYNKQLADEEADSVKEEKRREAAKEAREEEEEIALHGPRNSGGGPTGRVSGTTANPAFGADGRSLSIESDPSPNIRAVSTQFIPVGSNQVLPSPTQ